MYNTLELYHHRRNIMQTIVSLMTYKRFTRCNILLYNLSKNHSIDYDMFVDIVRVYECYTNEREKLRSYELRTYYNYCIINRIILPH